jgi:hypothetical protein
MPCHAMLCLPPAILWSQVQVNPSASSKNKKKFHMASTLLFVRAHFLVESDPVSPKVTRLRKQDVDDTWRSLI